MEHTVKKPEKKQILQRFNFSTSCCSTKCFIENITCLYKRHSVNVNGQIQTLLHCTVSFYSAFTPVNVNGAAII